MAIAPKQDGISMVRRARLGSRCGGHHTTPREMTCLFRRRTTASAGHALAPSSRVRRDRHYGSCTSAGGLDRALVDDEHQGRRLASVVSTTVEGPGWSTEGTREWEEAGVNVTCLLPLLPLLSSLSLSTFCFWKATRHASVRVAAVVFHGNRAPDRLELVPTSLLRRRKGNRRVGASNDPRPLDAGVRWRSPSSRRFG